MKVPILVLLTVGTLSAPYPHQPLHLVQMEWNELADRTMLAEMVYGEFANQSFEAKVLGAATAVTRAWKQGKTIEQVLAADRQYAGYPPMNYPPSNPIEREAMRESVEAAALVLAYPRGWNMGFFHTVNVQPQWGSGKRLAGRLGNTVFYWYE